MSAWSVLLVLSFVGIHHSMQVVSVGNAYLAFGCVIVMWGWHELAFLTGWLTGPRKVALDEGAQGWQRFAQAFQVVMHHELALVANFAGAKRGQINLLAGGVVFEGHASLGVGQQFKAGTTVDVTPFALACHGAQGATQKTLFAFKACDFLVVARVKHHHFALWPIFKTQGHVPFNGRFWVRDGQGRLPNGKQAQQ